MECAFCSAPAKAIIVATQMKVCSGCAFTHGRMRRLEVVTLERAPGERSCGHSGRLQSMCVGCDDWYDSHVFS